MHYAFIKKVSRSGTLYHLAHVLLAPSIDEARTRVLKDFENGKMPGEVLEKLIDFGQCKDGYDNSTDLYEKCCKQAAKLDSKAQGAHAIPPEEKKS